MYFNIEQYDTLYMKQQRWSQLKRWDHWLQKKLEKTWGKCDQNIYF